MQRAESLFRSAPDSRAAAIGRASACRLREGHPTARLDIISPRDRLVMHMTDPLSPSAMGAVALTEGIKFLYNQAGEVLKRWREARSSGKGIVRSAMLCPPEGLLVEGGEPVEPRDDVADSLWHELSEARKALTDYADGIEVARLGDQHVTAQVDALRRLLEVVYGQRLTFKGEDRPSPGTLVTGEINVEQVAGDAAAVRATKVVGGEIRGIARVGRVEEGAKLTGVKIDGAR